MKDSNKFRSIADDLRNIAQNYNVCIVTATQPKRPEPSWPTERLPRAPYNVIIVDYLHSIRTA